VKISQHTMSTGKRLAKRSILGTRIVAPGQDGRFYPAVIQAVKTCEPDRLTENRYTVRFDNSRKISEFQEGDLIGPGFAGLTNLTHLMAGQRVYITHLGREMEGTIMAHDTKLDQITVNLASGLQLKVRLEDIRLLESRKSSRLMNQTNTDFSKLADFNIVHERKRLNSEKSSDGSDFLGSRKRRGSETMSEEEERSSGDESGSRQQQRRGRRSGQRMRKEGRRRGEECGDKTNIFDPRKLFSLNRSGSPVIMTECTAAMVLMDLSCSPANRGRMSHASGHSDASSGQMSPSSSGVSSLGTSWSCPSPTLTPPFPLPPTEAEDPDPVEALLQLAANGRQCSLSSTNVTATEQESDEGIVSDQSNEFEENKKTEQVHTIYQCTWPGCKTQKQLCEEIERHVREKHLRRPAPQRPEDDDHEEEFYYNEIEVPVRSQVGKQQQAGGGSHTVAKLMGGGDQPTNLVVHKTRPTTVLTACPPAPVISDHMDMARPPHENPEYGGRPILPANNSAIATIISGGTALQWTSGEPQTPAPGPSTPVSASTAMHAMPIAIPITTLNIVSTSQQSPGKYIRLSPKPYSTSPKSPLRRPRGDAKKCRKVYGMEHREMWCTQCKWKKACTRFGEGA